MILTSSSSRNCKMTFIIARGFAERQILKTWKWPYLLNWVEYFDKLLCKHWYWQDCEMSFFIGRGFSELKILKKWKWPFLLNWIEYCDEILRTHWYWQDIAHEIVKWHLRLVEVLPRFKFWKRLNLTLKPFGIFWKNFADNLMLKSSSPRNCKMTCIIGRGFAECQILKK